jgi:hypothetical protein
VGKDLAQIIHVHREDQSDSNHDNPILRGALCPLQYNTIGHHAGWDSYNYNKVMAC